MKTFYFTVMSEDRYDDDSNAEDDHQKYGCSKQANTEAEARAMVLADFAEEGKPVHYIRSYDLIVPNSV